MFKKIVLGSVDLSTIPQKYCWYTVVTKFNYEEKYIENVQQAVLDTKLEKLISEYYIPIKYIKENVKLIDGSTKSKVHKIKGCFSNYVFIKCIMTKELWNMLRTTTGAAVILSTGGIPSYLSDSELKDIKNKQAMEGFSKQEMQELTDKTKSQYYMFNSKDINIEELLDNQEKVDE